MGIRDEIETESGGVRTIWNKANSPLLRRSIASFSLRVVMPFRMLSMAELRDEQTRRNEDSRDF